MEILPLQPEDLPRLSEIQPSDWGDITPNVTYYLNSPHCSPIKVVENNIIIGTGSAIRHKDTAWLALIIVHPQHRNRGLGGIITKYLVDMLKAEGVETVYLIATPMGEPVYKRLGFEIETEYLFFKGELKETETLPNIIPFEAKHLPRIYELDQQSYGENRWYRMDENLQTARVYEHNGKVEGFYLPSLSEGLIVAATPQAGIALMQLRAQTHEVFILPVDCAAGIEFLKTNGYQEVRNAQRMRLGKQRPFNPAMLYNRVGGPIG